MQFLKPTLPVQWHEGMLLSPQHFQQEAESLRSGTAFHQALSTPCGWGFETLQIDESLLPAGRVRLLTARLVFPDGTAVWYDARTDEELTLDLMAEGAEFEAGPVDLFLRLPISPQLNTPQRLGRYRPVVQAPIEDSVSEALPIDIPRLGMAMSLSCGAPPSGAFTTIRLGRVVSIAGVFRFDSTLPPLLRLHCAQALLDRIRSLLGSLRSKASFVARQVAGLARPELLAERTLMQQRLSAMVVALPQAEAVAQSQQASAWQSYMALVQLNAQLSQLNPATVPNLPPIYDHDNPSLSFDPLLESLEQLVLEISQDYREIRFSWSQNAFELELQRAWLDTRLVVGLHGESEQVMTDWMEVALIGEAGELDELMERRILGLRRLRVASADELGLRPLPKTVFFEIQPGTLLNSESPRLVIRPSSRTGPLTPPRSIVLYVANQPVPKRPRGDCRVTRREPELETLQVGSTTNPQIRQFRGLLQAIHNFQREQPTASTSAEDKTKAAAMVRDQLVQAIAAQELELAAAAAADELATIEETRYLKAALADELLLHSVWVGQSAQLDFLLEDHLFHTSHSGQEVFDRIAAVLRDPSARATYLSSIYLLVINAGFQGQYRGDPSADERLQEIAEQLFRRAYRRPAQGLSRAIHPAGRGEQRICHQAYENVLSGLAPVKVFRFTRGTVVFIGLFLALGLASQLIWLSISGPVRQALNDNSAATAGAAQTNQAGREQTR